MDARWLAVEGVTWGSDQHSNSTMTVEVAAGEIEDHENAPESEFNRAASAHDAVYTVWACKGPSIADGVRLLLSCAVVQRSGD